MTNSERLKAIVWDLGGVILRTEDMSHRERWERHLGFQPWGLHRLIFGSEMSQKASLGMASVEDIWNSIQTQLNISDSEFSKFKQDFFAGDRVDEELVTFIRQLRKHLKTGMITNAWPDTRRWIENEWKIADAFDSIVISSEVGIVKPDARIYHLFLETLQLAPEEALFIDDFIENVEGAKSIGMQSLHFRNPQETIQKINQLLRLPI